MEEDRVVASLLGTAIGDAKGLPSRMSCETNLYPETPSPLCEPNRKNQEECRSKHKLLLAIS
jgi:hypothetical protein